MKICITLDDVIRAKTKQFGKIYKKYINNDINLDELDLSTNDLGKIFNMGKKEYNKFLYEDYPFEIFAEASTMEKMLDKKLNLWHVQAADKGVELIIGNPWEFNASIGNTCFFLSKIAPKSRRFIFPSVSSELWDECDILVTADPMLLKNKPDGKYSVKIEMPYNKDISADKSYDSLSKMIEDSEFINWAKNCS